MEKPSSTLSYPGLSFKSVIYHIIITNHQNTANIQNLNSNQVRSKVQVYKSSTIATTETSAVHSHTSKAQCYCRQLTLSHSRQTFPAVVKGHR